MSVEADRGDNEQLRRIHAWLTVHISLLVSIMCHSVIAIMFCVYFITKKQFEKSNWLNELSIEKLISWDNPELGKIFLVVMMFNLTHELKSLKLKVEINYTFTFKEILKKLCDDSSNHLLGFL